MRSRTSSGTRLSTYSADLWVPKTSYGPGIRCLELSATPFARDARRWGTPIPHHRRRKLRPDLRRRTPVAMVKPAEHRLRDDLSRVFDRARHGRVPAQGHVAARLVVVRDVLAEEPEKVPFAERDDVVRRRGQGGTARWDWGSGKGLGACVTGRQARLHLGIGGPFGGGDSPLHQTPGCTERAGARPHVVKRSDVCPGPLRSRPSARSSFADSWPDRPAPIRRAPAQGRASRSCEIQAPAWPTRRSSRPVTQTPSAVRQHAMAEAPALHGPRRADGRAGTGWASDDHAWAVGLLWTPPMPRCERPAKRAFLRATGLSRGTGVPEGVRRYREGQNPFRR